MKRTLILASMLIMLVTLAAIPAGATTQYTFTYYLADGTGDAYYGYVFAPDGWFSVGSRIYNQPASMGGASLGGFY